MNMGRPAFSVASLAERWSCSSGLVRKLIKAGKLQAFSYGKLTRISANEVDRYEGNPQPAAIEQAPQPVESLPRPVPAPTMVRVESRGWPEAMRRSTAAAYCDLSVAAFEREVFVARLPQPFTLGGRDHWRKASIDAALDFLCGNKPLSRDDLPYVQTMRQRIAEHNEAKKKKKSGNSPTDDGSLSV